MTRKGRLWIGVTLLIIIVLNYAIVAAPLYRRSAYIKDKAKSMLLSQVKSGKLLSDPEDDYMLEIFKRERRYLDQRIIIVNAVAVTLALIVASWTVFGMIAKKK